MTRTTMASPCPRCDGSGYYDTPSDPCPVCRPKQFAFTQGFLVGKTAMDLDRAMGAYESHEGEKFTCLWVPSLDIKSIWNSACKKRWSLLDPSTWGFMFCPGCGLRITVEKET